MNYTSGNKEIANFMAKKWLNKPKYFNPNYESDWMFLMEVVEKIVRHEYEDGDTAYIRTFAMRADNDNLIMRFNRQPMFKDKSMIKALWKAVVNFCEWQNN